MVQQKPNTASKLHPRLRMYSNANSAVNYERAAQCAAMALKELPVTKMEPATVLTAAELSNLSLTLTRPKLTNKDNKTAVSVFVQWYDQAKGTPASICASIQGGMLETRTLTPEEIDDLHRDPSVALIEPGETLRLPRTLVSSSSVVTEPQPRSVDHAELHQDGSGLLIGIIDVAGFDFSHPDFLDGNSETRWVSIWDQGSETRPPPQWANFDYGSELSAARLNAALEAAEQIQVPAYSLEPQS